MAAPVGNKNAAKAKVWSAAIERALEKRAAERMPAINELAEKLIEMGLLGDLPALKEIGDRLEGKPTTVIAGDSDLPPVQLGVIELVRPS